jgi:hypothetical protein
MLHQKILHPLLEQCQSNFLPFTGYSHHSPPKPQQHSAVQNPQHQQEKTHLRSNSSSLLLEVYKFSSSNPTRSLLPQTQQQNTTAPTKKKDQPLFKSCTTITTKLYKCSTATSSLCLSRGINNHKKRSSSHTSRGGHSTQGTKCLLAVGSSSSTYKTTTTTKEELLAAIQHRTH